MKILNIFIVLLLTLGQTSICSVPQQIGQCLFTTFQLWMVTRELKNWYKEKEKKKIALTLGAAALGTCNGNSAYSWYISARQSMKDGKIAVKLPIIRPIDWHSIKQNPVNTATGFGSAVSQGIEKAFLLLLTCKSYEKLITQGWLKRSCWLGYHGIKFMFS